MFFKTSAQRYKKYFNYARNLNNRILFLIKMHLFFLTDKKSENNHSYSNPFSDGK